MISLTSFVCSHLATQYDVGNYDNDCIPVPWFGRVIVLVQNTRIDVIIIVNLYRKFLPPGWGASI